MFNWGRRTKPTVTVPFPGVRMILSCVGKLAKHEPVSTQREDEPTNRVLSAFRQGPALSSLRGRL